MRVLVTGGGGFLGSAVCRLLLARGDSVVCLQRSQKPDSVPRGMDWRSGDIADTAAVSAAARGCDAVIHTAAKAGIWGSEESYRRPNVDGTRCVIDACLGHGIGIMVHTSSPSIVHAGGDIEGGDESLPIPQHHPGYYPATKAEAERLVLEANGADLKTVALRPHLVWGPGDPHLLPRLVRKASGGRLALPGVEKHVDTVFVDNAAHAHLDALDDLRGRARGAGKPYFISNGEPLPQGEIIQRLLAAVGVEARIIGVPGGLARFAGAVCEFGWKTLRIESEPPVTRFAADQLATAHWFDISAARRDLSYEPRISIDEGLEILTRAHASGTAIP